MAVKGISELPVVIAIIDDDEHRETNANILEGLTNLGLKEGADYDTRTLPLAFGESYRSPMLIVTKKNPWGLRPERFFGQEAIEYFLNDMRERAASKG